ncbi:cysteine hydrolase family protein [Paenibacillus montanisoli]|uniref:Isochorismatase n=1 Tax=Paenibacillus montanisoli TaxID=2081970 RepID=A0A328TUV3_9BACL|nr:isochorismatase family cysteine hydrolase [Paenibacillus montanisoli]RAP74319.1 isochorismatase [Paenibacillus montanisoli]
MKALVVIDYTFDFVEGRLPVGQPAIAIEDRIAAVTRQFVKQGDFVVMAVDVHDEQDALHPEHKLFPPHNIRGTSGRELYGKLSEVYEAEKERIYWMDKTRYSAFAGTDLDLQLRMRAVQEIHLVGVCTDICVLHTAVDAYNRGFRIVVHADCAASFNPQGHEWALQHFQRSLGAELRIDDQPITI